MATSTSRSSSAPAPRPSPLRTPETAVRDARADELAEFAPLVIGVRWATVGVGIVLAAVDIGLTTRTIAGGAVLVAYALLRTLRPIRYLKEELASFLVVIGEVFLNLAVVVSTGYWDSPYVFCLATAIIAAGLARGFGFAMRTAVTAVAAVAIPYHLEALRPEAFRSAQGGGLLVLIALVAGYARRVLGEAEQRTTEAIGRIRRLTEANELLTQLHRVAQALPASLDLEETLQSTLGQLREAVPVDSAAIILRDRAGGGFNLAAGFGARFPASLNADELPAAVAEVVGSRTPRLVAGYDAAAAGGMSDNASAGIYAPLLVRDELIGILVAERRASGTLHPAHLEVVNDICAQAGLAIENARWFRLLRSVGADEERTRIARDLHDRVGQSLTYLAFELDRITRKPESQALHDDLEQLRNDVRRTVTEVRETLHDLRTDVSEEKDLVSVLRSFVERVEERIDGTVSFTFDAPARLPLRQEREMWRIAQEAIANAERHAHASRIDVSWSCTSDVARLEVTDDGVGISDAVLRGTERYGLVGMRERAEAIGARLEIDRGRPTGTVVRCQLETS